MKRRYCKCNHIARVKEQYIGAQIISKKIQRDFASWHKDFLRAAKLHNKKNLKGKYIMNAERIILEIAEAGISLYLKDGNLSIKAPKGALTSELREKLKSNKAELIACLEQTSNNRQNVIQIEKYTDEEKQRIPLTYAQSRLWLNNEFEPNSTNYNICFPVRFNGELDVDTLKFSLNKILERHEILRTVYRKDENSSPYQLIQKNVALDLPMIDISHIDVREEQEQRLKELILQESDRPFVLSEDLMLRAILVRESQYSHVLILAIHHIASDGWSTGILTTEISEFYRSGKTGHTPALPELEIQYADYAIWQRKWLQSEMLKEQLDYWSEQLAGIPVLHNLPLDRPRPTTQSYEGSEVHSFISIDKVNKLNQFAKSQGVTLFMLLNAVYALLLSRHSGQDDIIIGTSVANREMAELSGLMGCFVNTLVLRSHLGGNPTFGAFLQQTKTRLLGAYQHQQIPIEKLIDELQPERSFSHTPLFQVMLLMQNNSKGDLDINDMEFEALDRDISIANFDLTLDVTEESQRMNFRWEYATALFNQSTIKRFAEHFNTLLDEVIKHPQLPIQQLACFSEKEQILLEQFNQTQQDFDISKTVVELFECQVERHPNKEILLTTYASMTYEELNSKANKLANYLKQNGVRADTLIGICVERSEDMVVGLLAILKAGGAYVPLDPNYPADRLAYILQDSEVQLLVTQQQLVERLPITTQTLICLDDSETLAEFSAQNLSVQDGYPNASSLAYVIYTSGSTGKPKGVMVEHRNLSNFLFSMQQSPGIDQDDVLLAVTSYSFDIHTLEVFLPLISSARLMLASQGETQSPLALAQMIEQHQVSIMQATPATWKMLLDNDWQATSPIKLLCGGEALSESLKEALLEGEHITLWNMFGPTETSVWSSVGEMSKDQRVNIGRPIANTHFYVVDDSLNKVPIGVVGELLIGGDGVTQGYLNRDSLTAERFISNPFGSGQLYRTGDLVRWLEDGRVEYFSRTDSQVKIRGHRIELGEVEAAIVKHPSVKEAVVVAWDEPARLVAYIVCEQDQTSIEALRRYLNGHLPIYMIPSLFMFLDKLPLTPNGKIDRKALPTPSINEQDKAEYVAPTTETEQTLCKLWQDILGCDKVGAKDNFFMIGGHSLFAAQLAGEIHRQWQVQVSIKDVFEQQTLADLAKMIDESEIDKKQTSIICNDGQKHALSFAQQRLWLIDQIDENSSQYNMPFALRLDGNLHLASLHSALETIISRHSVLRTTFGQDDKGQGLQIINAAPSFDITIADLTYFDEQQQDLEVQKQCADEAGKSFDLSADLLIRAKLLKLSERAHVLMVTVHHIAFDAWSISLLTQEFAELYKAAVLGKEASLPELPVQYSDYAVWQREQFAAEALAEQVSYWKNQLANLPALHSLPLDKPRPAIPTYQADRVEQLLSIDVLEELNRFAKKQGASLFMVLHAAFSALLNRYSGEQDIVVGTTVANRPMTELQPLIGFFVNSLVLRTDFSEDLNFRGLVKQCRSNALDAYEYQDLPFERLVDELQPDRSLSHNALFQVMLTLHNNASAELELPGLNINFVDYHHGFTQFDLSLDAYESSEGLRIRWEYATDLFERRTMQQMTHHFELLIKQLLASPEKAISGLNFLPDNEKQTLLHDFNGKQVQYKMEATIHAQFEKQVGIDGNAIAVVHGERVLTYNEVNQKANQLAHYLMGKGVHANVLVGIYSSRRPEFLISVLAIFKAGGTYVPLDPINPRQRIDYMISDAGFNLLLCEQSLLDSFTSVQGLEVLCIEKLDNLLIEQSKANPNASVGAKDNAYMIYTSGSTGNPKGALVHHAGAMNHIFAEFDVLEFMSAEGNLYPRNFLQSAATSSDVSVWQFLAPVVSGGKTVILDDMTCMPTLVGLLQTQQIHLIQTAPVVLQLLVNYLEQGVDSVDLGELKWLMTIAEPTPVGLINRWFDLAAHVPIMNGYGPSEASDDITQFIIKEKLPEAMQSVPVGQPLPNLSMYVLDKHQNLLPIGVVGELCVSGVGVGSGYWNNKAKTKDSFVPNPYGNEHGHGNSLYRTGDLGRWLANGDIELVGRIDNQVKVRGFRVELGEIEAALAKFPDVGDVAVLLKKNKRGENYLAAYLVSKTGVPLDREMMRELLVENLPDYMVPSSYTWLDKMPLNAADKIDRKALPEANIDAELEVRYVAPSNATEQALCAVWQDILGLERVGVTDNFFGIGGDSILSVQVASRAGQAGVYVTLRQIFEYQTIFELAKHAAAAKLTDTPQELVVGEQRLLPVQREFLRTDKIDQSHYNLSLLLSVPKDLNLIQVKAIVDVLYQRHDALRLQFTDDGTSAIYRDYTSEMVERSIAEYTITEGEWQTQLEKVCGTVQQSLSLSEGPLIQFALINDGQHYRLLMVLHHMVCDGISWRVLLNDLSTAHEQLLCNKTIQLAQKTSSLQQWGDFLYEYAQSNELTKQIDFWQRQLDSDVEPLPVDANDPSDNSWQTTEQHIITLDQSETKQLLTECHHAYGTQINDLMLSAIYLGLNRWSGNKKIRVYLEGHGREGLNERLDMGETLGWFTSVYPLVMKAENTDIASVIIAIKEMLRKVPDNGIGFGVLTEMSQKLIYAASQSISQSVMFNYLGQFDQALNEQSELAIAPESSGIEVSEQRQREHQLGFTSMISDGCLSIKLDYNKLMYKPETVNVLVRDIENSVKQIIQHCSSQSSRHFTSSDFPLADVQQSQLEQWQQAYPNIVDLYSATSMQQGLLFHSELDSSAYVSQVDVKLHGELDVKAFVGAWEHVLNRHAALRTAFVGKPAQQLVLSNVCVPWEEIDLQGMTAEQQEVQFIEHKKALKEQGFDITVAPLMKVSLFRLDGEQYHLLWTYHHALLDGWSSPLVMSEVVHCYRLLSNDMILDFPDVPSYASYIAWLQNQNNNVARDFWRDYLREVESCTPLGIETLNHDKPSFAQTKIQFSKKQTNAFKAFTMSNNITLNTLLQGAWAYLLHIYSQEQQVVFGETVSGRPADLVDVENIVGLFINTVPVYVSFKQDMSPVEWLQNLLQSSVARNEFGYLPLIEIGSLSPIKSAHLFDSLMVFENYPADDSDKLGLESEKVLQIQSMDSDEQTNFKLTLIVVPGEELQLKIGYQTNCFERCVIERMASHIQQILSNLVNETPERVLDIQYLSTDERAELLAQVPQAEQQYPTDKSIHALFEEQVLRTPDAVAVEYEGAQLSYAQLNAQANQLAHYLRDERGVGPDTLVGLCVERSLAMVVGLLGILKAGGAYVPLDPDYPQERLAYMLDDAQLETVLTHSTLVTRVGLSKTQGVCLDDSVLHTTLAAHSEENPVVAGLTSAHLAYVIYTSGSTGQPKGVMVEHLSVVRLVSEPNFMTLDAHTRFLQAAPISFDAATLELWAPLLNGGVCVLYPQAPMDLSVLNRVLSTAKVNSLWLTAGLFEQWSEVLPELMDLRYVIAGGDVLNPQAVNRVLQALPHVTLVNGYGPTENTTFTCCYTISDETLVPVPIGRAINGTQLYVLNTMGQLLPRGVVGELYVGGDGLARGYLGQEALTAERFIENPFGAGRLYKTGDLVRYLDDGNMAFIGRADNQIKIRGFRVELGEIEACLQQHSAVNQAVVVATEEHQALVAYVVVDGDGDDSLKSQLRTYLEGQLPAHFVPSAFIFVDAFALTANGKLDRKALPTVSQDDYFLTEYVAPESDIQTQLCQIWCDVLDIAQVGIDDKFFDAGGNSLLSMKLQRLIETQLQVTVSITDIFTYPTIRSFAQFLQGEEYQSVEETQDSLARYDEDIAVIGMAIRFPDADNPQRYWNNLCQGLESIQTFSDDALRKTGVSESLLTDPCYVKSGFVMPGLAEFDADYFGFTPREAELMDPQQRLLFECADEALEVAGYGCRQRNHSVGVFVGVGENRYLFDNILSNSDVAERYDQMSVMLNNSKDFVATRLSHRLNLQGPSINVGTACSTSLVAINQACSSLLDGSCEVALAGGASVHLLQAEGTAVIDGGIASLDGHCRPFDAQASGTRAGSGAGVVLLKRLSAALRDGDEIHAVIKGSAVNNDGSDKVGYTAPSVEGQTQVLRKALSRAGVDANTIGYIETHGTGTKLGDPIEVAALKRVYGRDDSPCALGAVKANIGHLDSAAGVAGFVKAVLAVKHGQLPPNIHFQTLSPEIVLEGSGFYLNKELATWPQTDAVRRAAVSSFGMGGTNAHVVLEAPPQRAESLPVTGRQVVVLSAKSEKALQARAMRLLGDLDSDASLSLADVAYSLQEGCSEHEYRYALSCDSLEELRAGLSGSWQGTKAAPESGIAFLFSGQGSQYVGMGAGLYAGNAVFKAEFDRCATYLQPLLGEDIRLLVYGDGDAQQMQSRLKETRLTQPVLFSFEYALVQMWASVGVKPSVMLGHSLGEYVAATVAGVFSVEDALSLLVVRGGLMQETAPGAMISVGLSAEDAALRGEAYGCSVAAVNGALLSVLSGPSERVTQLAGELESEGVLVRRLETSHAYHSAQMTPILSAYEAQLSKVTFNAPQIEFMSNVTGRLITTEEATSKAYWVRHLREAVQFSDAVKSLIAQGYVFLEVGPGRVLTDLAKRHDGAKVTELFASVRPCHLQRDDLGYFQEALAGLWQHGHDIVWSQVRGAASGKRVSLSGYPYERRRYWIEAGQATSMGAAVRSQRVEDWLYAPVWSTFSHVAGLIAAPQEQSFSNNGVAILLSDDSVLIDTLVSQIQLAHPALPIIKVRRADSYLKIDPYYYEINPSDTAHYDEMIEEIKALNWQPELVVHGWGIRKLHTEKLEAIDFEKNICSLFHLSHALEQFSNTIELKLLANNLSAVDADDPINAEHAGILPVSQIISSEYPNLRCHTIDLHDDGIELSAKMQKLLGQVVLTSQDDYISVLKGGRCWKRTFEQLEIQNTPENSHLKENGIYIITGGLGGIGFSLAQLLADKYRAKLVLIGRSDLPDESNDIAPQDAEKIAKIKLLEEKGAEVTYIQCDVADESSVGNLISRVEAQIGPVNGVVHSAGVPGGGLMALRTIDEIQSVLAPKVSGTANLVNHLAGKELDFFVMCSSLASIIGEVAQFEYSAANAYLDAIAHKFSQSSTKFISINWDAWGESGMAFTAELPEWMKSRQQTDLADAISDEEGRRVFERILQNDFTQVVVSRFNVNTINSQNVEFDQERLESSVIQHSRPELNTEYVAPQSEMEFQLVKIIQDALGVEPVGLKDNFFELGCDSLLLVKVVAVINTQWGTSLSLKMLFDHPCVEAVVGMIHRDDDNDVQVRDNENIVEEGLI